MTGLGATPGGAELAGDRAALVLRNDLVFGLIEGVAVIHRYEPGRPVAAFAEATADAALRTAGVIRHADPARAGSGT